MNFSRRHFLKGTSASLAAVAMPSAFTRLPQFYDANGRRNSEPLVEGPALAELIANALDAARRAGATYVDARYLSRMQEFWGRNGQVDYDAPSIWLAGGFSVRALYNGYWGYAALEVGDVTTDAAVRLGREAAAQARTGAKGKPRTVELAAAPVVANGKWTTPIEIDPFTVAWDEKVDVLNGFVRYFQVQPFGAGSNVSLRCTKQEQTFGSSEGSFYTQTLYRTGLSYYVGVGSHWRTEKGGMRSADSFVSMAGAGWEYVLKAPLEVQAERLLSQARDATQAIPVDVGRYDIVFDGVALAKVADVNLGPATELDRAMGYLANDVGTSYLNDPLAMLGHQKVGSPLLSVTANRSMPGGAGTVRWDDEGVEPDEAVLVKDGILTDFQTTRESASWLAPYYKKRGLPIRSHGGAMSEAIAEVPKQGPHNLVLAPSAQDTSFEALCSGVKKGLAVFSGRGKSDHQALNTESYGDIVYEITNGKLGRAIEGAVMLTRAPEFWKNLVGVGGPQTVCAVGLERYEYPDRLMPHTVSAPAGLVKQVPVIANARRSI